tara:strand:+ start:1253 stop:1798 length:546 start_codon:yes stop_codon:yes gene_type:complete
MSNKKKNSEEFLNSISGKKNGFSVPKNYFNTIEEVIHVKLIEERFKNKSGFEIPNTYFKEFEEGILAKVVSPSTVNETKIISFKQRILKIIPITVAASVLIFIGLNSFVFDKNAELTLDALSENEIEYWLNSSDIYLNDIAIVESENLLEENDFYFSSIGDEIIEEYMYSIDNSYLLYELN